MIRLKTLARTECGGRPVGDQPVTLHYQRSGETRGVVLRVDGGPGSWYLATLLGVDEWGRGAGDVVPIDAGQAWHVTNMRAILADAVATLEALAFASESEPRAV